MPKVVSSIFNGRDIKFDDILQAPILYLRDRTVFKLGMISVLVRKQRKLSSG
jgi:hypothetical protein